MNAQTLALSQSTRAHRVMRVCGMVLLMAMMMTLVVFAGGNGTSSTITDISSGIQSGVSEAYNLIKAIVLPIAALCLAWCAIKAIFGGQRGMEEAKKFALIIVCAVAVVLLAPLIIQTVAGWFGGSSVTIDNMQTP